MKNIHVLQTDKSSRLYLTTHEYIFEKEYSLSTDECQNKNIYITSYKSPSMNGYYLLNDNVVCKKDETYFATNWKEREIILTTDQDLIDDGVQEIDDEFLEWFVKNSSCEEVEIEKEQYHQFVGMKKIPLIPNYKIIIPKKNFYCGDEVDYDDKCLEQCDRCVDATGVDYGYLPEEHVELINKNIEEFDKKVNEQKQNIINMMKGDEELGLYDETLGEAALKYSAEPQYFGKISGFRAGAKWQMERSYSEEEVNEMFDTLKRNAIDNVATISNVDLFISSWKQQFKKK